MTGDVKAAVSSGSETAQAEAEETTSIVSRMTFSAPAAEVWKALIFYEQVEGRPPFYLRLLLPIPIRAEGQVSKVGDEATCLYEGGFLLKRITKIVHSETYEFEVAEQALSFGGGIRLSGGGYALRSLAGGGTEVAIETRYTSSKWPRYLWQPLEKTVCHWFHRYLLGSMRRQLEAG